MNSAEVDTSGVDTAEVDAALELFIAGSGDVVVVRQRVRTAAQEVGMSVIDQTKLVTAASELARNTLVYGGGGQVRIDVVSRGARRGLRLVFSDEGPGIADPAQALTDGWSSGGGLGLGLSGSRRLVDEFDLASEPGRGTRVMVLKWAR